MTDREMLEAAAKAAGMALVDGEHGDMLRVYYTDPHNGLNRYTPWNPLTDDGDALRLAVVLGLTINPYQEGVFVSRYEDEKVIGEKFKAMGQPDFEATRRAIVRAAAEIGKGM